MTITQVVPMVGDAVQLFDDEAGQWTTGRLDRFQEGHTVILCPSGQGLETWSRPVDDLLPVSDGLWEERLNQVAIGLRYQEALEDVERFGALLPRSAPDRLPASRHLPMAGRC